MKKLILLLIALSMLVCLFACGKSKAPEIDESKDILEKDELIKIRIYGQYCDGPIFHYKSVQDCKEAYALIELLNNAKKTGESVPKISDDVIDESVIREYPVEFGTTWVEIADRIYRISHDDSQIWLVKSHFGEGEEIEMTNELKKAVHAVWGYNPNYVYNGMYIAGDETVELEVTNEGNSPIRMKVKSIYIQESYPCENKITLELTSSEDIDTVVTLQAKQSEGNIGGSDNESLSLKKDVPETVELEFVGFPYSYRVYINADRTSAVINIAELISSSEGIPKCVSVENGKYYLTLPKSKTKLDLGSEPYNFTKYAPFITDYLVLMAEREIEYELSDYSENSGFYLFEKDDYLCLAVEVIEHLDEPNEKGEDHEHVFFIERISKRVP